MCGISCLVSEKRNWSILQKMHHHQVNRGPDGHGSYIEGNIGICHNRLSIVDLSNTARQPMESTRWVLSYNGELYNHIDLRQKLGPMHWASHSDTLTLLNCIEHKGIEWTLQNIEGMHSFLAYNKVEKKIYLAVDPYGIKPMFWYADYDTFAVASSPGALTHLKDKWSLDTGALFNMLALGATKEPLFEGMNRLSGGMMLIYDLENKSVTTTRYYERKEHQCTEGDLIDVVKESIRSVKMADVPVFMFLSGGIDSSIVASQCYGMSAVHLDSPEAKFAQEVAEKYGNPLHFILPKEYDAEECLKDYAFQSGDCSAAAIVPYIVSKMVSKFGKVAISANGSDEICFGYHRMMDRVSLNQFKHIFRELPHNWGNYKDYNSTRELELDTYVQYDLNKTLDFASMCFGLEIRVPYLNKTVVEMALSLQRKDHVNGYGDKSILKRFLKSEGFSDEFLTRPKLGFSLFTHPSGYEVLKLKGMALLKDKFNISPDFTGVYSGRDKRYFENIAAAFHSWYKTWRDKLL